MTHDHTPPPGWCRLPNLTRQLGITNASACKCAHALARIGCAMQTPTGRWYVDPAAFAERAMRTVRKLRVQSAAANRGMLDGVYG